MGGICAPESDHILVTGSHRSGTTWVGRTIARHPAIRYIAEPFNVTNPNYLMDLKLGTWFSHYDSSGQQREIREAFDKILTPQSAFHYAVDVCRASGWDAKLPLRFAKHFWLAKNRPRVLVKDPLALLSAEWMHRTYGVRVLCMTRNPFAFVGSVKVTGWDVDFDHFRRQNNLMNGWLAPYAGEIQRMCGSEGDFIDRVSLLWNILHYVIADYRRRFPSWLFVRYEDLALRPMEGFRSVFDTLGLEMGGPIQKYIAEYTAMGNAVTSRTDAYQPRDARKSVGTWKERLTPDEIERVANATAAVARLLYGDEETSARLGSQP